MSLPESAEQFLLFLALVVQVGFAGVLVASRRRRPLQTALLILVLSLAFWSVSLLIGVSARNATQALWAFRAAFVGPLVALGGFLEMALLFPPRPIVWPRVWHLILHFPLVVMLVLSFSPWLVMRVAFPRAAITSYGSLHPWYALVVLVYLIIAYVIFVQKFRLATGRERLQVWYVLVGISLTAATAILTNLLIPLFTGISALASIGPASTLFVLGFTSYAIVRYRLLGIEDFFRRAWGSCLGGLLIFGSVAIMTFGEARFLPTFLIMMSNLALGSLILIHNWRSRLHQSFATFPLASAIWAVALYVARNSTNLSQAALASRIVFLATALMPVVFLYFTWVFPELKKRLTGMQGIALFSPVLIFAPAILMGHVSRGVLLSPHGNRPIYGSLYPFFSLYIVVYAFGIILSLFRKYRALQGISRLQIRYVFVGLFGMALVSITTNLLLPVLGVAELTWIGPASTLVLVGSVSYSILRHRLMSVEFVLRQGALYGLVMVAMMLTYTISVFLFERVLSGVVTNHYWITTALAALVITLTFQPLLSLLQALFERWLTPSRTDYQRTVRDVSRGIASVIRLEDLVNLIVDSFARTVGISEVSLLLVQAETRRFRSVAPELVREPERYRFVELPEESAVVGWLSATREPIFKDELQAALDRAILEGNRRVEVQLSPVLAEVERIGSDNWVPIMSRGKLLGIILLGYKLSGDIYTAEDAALLSTLASQIAVSMENTQLYEEILRLKDYSENILRTMANGILTVDREGRVVTYNRTSENLLGVSADDVVGKPIQDLWGDNHPLVVNAYATLRGRAISRAEIHWNHPDRGDIPVALSTLPLSDRKGRPLGALLVLQDMTEIRELESRIRRADKLAAIGTMAAGMAHEIKNPLASMKALIQLLPKKIPEPSYQEKLLAIMPREIERVDRIVEGLLAFARSSEPRATPLDIHSVLSQALEDWKEKAERSGVKIVRQFGTLPRVVGDATQLFQVFSNITLNALQAMPEGGLLTVMTQPLSRDNGSPQGIQVTISDTGVGIPAENLTKLFDPFFSTKYGGTGLGLAISHSIVEGHQGSIDVRSQVGKGTSFIVALPLKGIEAKDGTTTDSGS